MYLCRRKPADCLIASGTDNINLLRKQDPKTIKEDYNLLEYYINRTRGYANLNLSLWLGIVIKLIRDGATWELYSNVLAYFATTFQFGAFLVQNGSTVVRELLSAANKWKTGKLAVPKPVAKAVCTRPFW